MDVLLEFAGKLMLPLFICLCAVLLYLSLRDWNRSRQYSAEIRRRDQARRESRFEESAFPRQD